MERLLHLLYGLLGTGLYVVVVFLFPLVRFLSSRYGYGFEQRLGRYSHRTSENKNGRQTIWLHASSVGEVQAAIILIKALSAEEMFHFILTSTSEQGNKIAQNRLPGAVECLMAPLDMPPAVSRALQSLRPDVYICLETELWPAMLTQLRKNGVPMLLLNGRLSERSYKRYRWIGSFMRTILEGFQSIAVISEADREHFIGLGVPESRVQVCGNLKYDMPVEHPEQMRIQQRQRLGVADQLVFLCGSTHGGEEELLLPVFQKLSAVAAVVWVIAPRHLERLPMVEAFLQQEGIASDRYSNLPASQRTTDVVLVDTMGDLPDIYASAEYIFCGGSLVDRGGHNIMEAARWGRPVSFGPYMKDFRDVADALILAGGGYQVADSEQLAALWLSLHDHPDVYQAACDKAFAFAAKQRGAVHRQAELVKKAVEQRGNVTADPAFLS